MLFNKYFMALNNSDKKFFEYIYVFNWKRKHFRKINLYANGL